MSVSEADTFSYYEQSDYSKYHDDWFWEKERFSKEKYPNTYVPRQYSYNPNETTVNYFNERQCPIYNHLLRKDSSLITNYNYETKKPSKKTSNDNNSKLVLDKLEENYWDMWRPKKPKPPSKSEKFRKNIPSINESYDFKEHTAAFENQRKSRNSHGDNVFVSYFKSFQNTEVISKKSEPTTKRNKKVKAEKAKKEKIESSFIQDNKVDAKNLKNPNDEPKNVETPLEDKKDKDEIIDVKGTRSTRSITADTDENKFVTHKDSVVITKEKLEKMENKEHYQLPKSIRLYRKAGASSSVVKGGSYPLKTCLKKEPTREALPKGNFRLGAPGSSLLFVTTKNGK